MSQLTGYEISLGQTASFSKQVEEIDRPELPRFKTIK